MSRKIHLLLCRLKFFSQLEMPLSVLFSELFEKARVKVRITAYLEQFYGEAKNSRTIMYAKIFCPPRNHSIYTVLQTFGKSSYNGQLIQILRTEKMLTYYYVRSAFFFLKSYFALWSVKKSRCFHLLYFFIILIVLLFGNPVFLLGLVREV